MPAASRKAFAISLPFEQVMPAIEQALMKMGAQVYREQIPENIKAKTGRGRAGENISITVRHSQSRCYVEVVSMCASTGKLIDWGSNENNVQTFAKELSTLLQLPVVPKSLKDAADDYALLTDVAPGRDSLEVTHD